MYIGRRGGCLWRGASNRVRPLRFILSFGPLYAPLPYSICIHGLWRAVRVLYEICFISRPCTGVNNAASPFFRSLVADATGHFDALTKMGWLVALEGGRGNSHKCSGFCSALVITRLLIVFRHDVPLFIAVSFFVAYYLSGCWFNLLRLFSIQHVQDVIIICLKIEKF